MAIERMTKNLNPGILSFYVFFFVEGSSGGGGGVEGSRARACVGRKVGAIIFICDTLINLIHIALYFHQDITSGYLVMAYTRTSLEIYRRDGI